MRAAADCVALLDGVPATAVQDALGAADPFATA